MIKIAIMGKVNTGKNTLAKMLAKQIRNINNGYDVYYVALADPIKNMVLLMFPTLPRKYLFGSSKFRNEIIPGAFKDGIPLTIRQLLLDLGTKIGRGYQENIWLNNFDNYFNKICNIKNRYLPSNKIVILTDVRFRNEFDHLKNKGFYMIRLYRPSDEPEINHISESNQNLILDSEFNYVLHNDKSLADLKAKIISDIIPNLKDI